jgi:thiol-disulfide isomerase/thioredoxin
MRFPGALPLLLLSIPAIAQTPASELWRGLQAKREKLAGYHQEFEVSQTFKLADHDQASKRQVILDAAAGQWRETSVSGSGDRVRIFDGTNLFVFEAGGDEYERPKRKVKDGDPLPSPYAFEAEWQKAVEAGRQPCNSTPNSHVCIILDVPLKKTTQLTSAGKQTHVLAGTLRLFMDVETGLLLASRSLRTIQTESSTYQAEVSYMAQKIGYGAAPDAALFKLPPGDPREVKELSKWNASKIKKQLAGKPAPELIATDIEGKPVSLAAFKGKTVLLDFWTTWCPPCRADAPALDKLYQRYNEKDLMIVGISVSEDRPIVEKFLKEHPHAFPVLLTTENDLPRPYQIGTFPTYIVIDPDGAVTSAVEGDQGFGELRKLLKKAGLDTD